MLIYKDATYGVGELGTGFINVKSVRLIGNKIVGFTNKRILTQSSKVSLIETSDMSTFDVSVSDFINLCDLGRVINCYRFTNTSSFSAFALSVADWNIAMSIDFMYNEIAIDVKAKNFLKLKADSYYHGFLIKDCPFPYASMQEILIDNHGYDNSNILFAPSVIHLCIKRQISNVKVMNGTVFLFSNTNVFTFRIENTANFIKSVLN